MTSEMRPDASGRSPSTTDSRLATSRSPLMRHRRFRGMMGFGEVERSADARFLYYSLGRGAAPPAGWAPPQETVPMSYTEFEAAALAAEVGWCMEAIDRAMVAWRIRVASSSL